MSYHAFLLAPLVVLLPAAGSVDSLPDIAGDPASIQDRLETSAPAPRYAPPVARENGPFRETPFDVVAEAMRAQAARQVRIEQRMTIRVSPRAQPIMPNMLADLPGREVGPRFLERKMGKCLSVSGIAGVQPNGDNRLLLFLRDRRMVSAELERSCRARDFYSGFYLSRNNDGQLCVDRDMLLSRSGANCRLTRIRQLVESDE